MTDKIKIELTREQVSIISFLLGAALVSPAREAVKPEGLANTVNTWMEQVGGTPYPPGSFGEHYGEAG